MLRGPRTMRPAALALCGAALFGCSGSGTLGSSDGPSDAGGATDATASDASAVDGSVEAAPRSDRIDVNDVSVLFPIPASSQEGALLLGLASAGLGGPLLTTDHFAQLGGGATPAPGLQPYDAWRILGLRFDPCGLDAEDGGCVPQLRLVAQVPTFGTSSSGQPTPFADQAIHLIYAIDPALVSSLERDLRALKAASPVPTTGVRLGVHPGLAEAGIASDYAQQVEAFILEYAFDPALSRVAVTFLTQSASWFFTAVNVDHGVFSPFVVPGTTSDGITVFEGVFLPPPLAPRHDDATDAGAAPDATPAQPPAAFTPTPVGTDNVAALVAAVIDGPPDASAIQAATEASVRIDNPDLDDVFHVDCVSCHVASRFVSPLSTSSDPNTFALPPGVTGTLPPPDGQAYVVRAFGYDPNGLVGITARTVNESAKVAAEIEALGP